MKCLYSVRHLLQQISLRKTLVTDKTQKKKKSHRKGFDDKQYKMHFSFLKTYSLYFPLSDKSCIIHQSQFTDNLASFVLPWH